MSAPPNNTNTNTNTNAMQAKKPHKYADLDAAILNAIKEGANTFSLMSIRHDVTTAAMKVRADEGQDHNHGKKEYRYIDARLQAMRRAGKIKFVRNYVGSGAIWSVVEAA